MNDSYENVPRGTFRNPLGAASYVDTDPTLIAMARELRDRWMEEVHAGKSQLSSRGKYEVGRQRWIGHCDLREGRKGRSVLSAA